MINLDMFSHYKADGLGGVEGKCKKLKIRDKQLLSNIVYLTGLDGKRYTVSVARLTHHQLIRKLESDERVYVSSNSKARYIDRIHVYKAGEFNPNMVKKINILEKHEICYKYELDKTIVELSKEYGVSSQVIRVILRGKTAGCVGSYLYQQRCPPGGKRGDYLKKVDEEVVEKIMSLYGKNKSKAAIGRELSLSAETVSKYIKREKVKSGTNN